MSCWHGHHPCCYRHSYPDIDCGPPPPVRRRRRGWEIEDEDRDLADHLRDLEEELARLREIVETRRGRGPTQA